MLPLIPGSFAVAVLRYRLYDIDRLISRAVAWSLLTSLLVATYFVATLVLGSLLQPGTGRSTVSVAGSTLIVAALVGPLRRSVQSAVDRRFNRSRHDAVRTVQAFRGQLRSELDLDRLSDELRPSSRRRWNRRRSTCGCATGTEPMKNPNARSNLSMGSSVATVALQDGEWIVAENADVPEPMAAGGRSAG